MLVRPATTADAPALARIYNQGIEDRSATFETTLRSEYDVLGWLDGVHPIVVVVDEPPAGQANEVIAFARATEYRARECYRGIFEFAVYTDRAHRRRGAALLAMRELITRSREAGAWKLVSRIFVENGASRALMLAAGFREVGTYYRHAKLEDRWRDVVIVEKFLAPIGAIPSVPPAMSRGSRGDVLASLRTKDADPNALAQALEWSRAIIDSFKRPDADLLEAALDGFFFTNAHPAPVRAQFIELFRAYAALSEDASDALYTQFFARLGRIPLTSDLDAFYEALFVVKQVAGGAGEALRPHVNALVEWMRTAVDLPPGVRGRISAGNVVSLLMTLAASASPTQEQRQTLAELAVIAKLRHRVDAPLALKSPASASIPPPPPTARREAVALEDDVPIPLSSRDFLPESTLEPMVVPAPEPEPPAVSAKPKPKPKRVRRSTKKNEPTSTAEPKKRASRSRKKPKPEG